MLAVYGTAVFCGGLLFFYFMLHLHRRHAAAWLELPGIGAVILYTSMMATLYGIAMWGQYAVKQNTPYGMAEGIETIAILALTALAIWKLYLPPPAPEKAPAPANDAGRQAGHRPAERKRAA